MDASQASARFASGMPAMLLCSCANQYRISSKSDKDFIYLAWLLLSQLQRQIAIAPRLKCDVVCPLLAQTRHELLRRTCPLSGVKRDMPFCIARVHRSDRNECPDI
jgi:hypothetical protein